MKDFLAAILIVLIVSVFFCAISDKAPSKDDSFKRTVCANMTCNYEIKDQK